MIVLNNLDINLMEKGGNLKDIGIKYHIVELF